jgi:hypothetical protein
MSDPATAVTRPAVLAPVHRASPREGEGLARHRGMLFIVIGIA